MFLPSSRNDLDELISSLDEKTWNQDVCQNFYSLPIRRSKQDRTKWEGEDQLHFIGTYMEKFPTFVHN